MERAVVLHAKRISKFLAKPRDFRTRKARLKYLLCCLHGVHLGLLSRETFIQIFEQVITLENNLCATSVGNPIIQPKTKFNPYRTKHYRTLVALIDKKWNFEIPDIGTWTATLNGFCTSVCSVCEICHCGCGKTYDELKQQRSNREAEEKSKSYRTKLVERGYTKKQIQIIEMYKSFCVHRTRYGVVPCPCTIENILAEFGQADRVWIKKHAKRKYKPFRVYFPLRKETILVYDEILPPELNKVLRRHVYFCDRLKGEAYCECMDSYNSLEEFAKALLEFRQAVMKRIGDDHQHY